VSDPFAYRASDGTINLEEALGPHLRHYVSVMVSGANGTRTQLLTLGRSETSHGILLRQGFGCPTRASSRGTLAVLPEWSWDVCGYYVSLGVHWTATRGEIRRAYIAACAREGGQHQDEYLTYVMAQLGDERIRRLYDLVPLGGVFLLDRYVETRIKRAAAAEAARRVAEGGEATTEDVLDEMGLHEEPRAPQGGEPGAEDGPEPVQEAPRSRWGVVWGHYLLAGSQGVPVHDTALLEAWQGMVAAALRARGIVMEFAVGQGDGNSPLVLQNVKEACIFVVTQEGASPEKASEAVEMGISLGIVAYNSERGS
jgi:hypothetical protein